jgi:hypothetical protein
MSKMVLREGNEGGNTQTFYTQSNSISLFHPKDRRGIIFILLPFYLFFSKNGKRKKKIVTKVTSPTLKIHQCPGKASTNKGKESRPRSPRKRLTFTLCGSRGGACWTFRDGVSIEDELRNIEISKIRAVCDQQSRTRWTTIASRNRLYQFMALSDEQSQLEMRQKALSLVDMNSGPAASPFEVSAAGSSSSPSLRTDKLKR